MLNILRELGLKISAKLKEKSAETLLESIVSILMISILMLAVGTYIMTAMKISSINNKNSEEFQEMVNEVKSGGISGGTTESIIFQAAALNNLTRQQEVLLTSEDELVAFIPKS